jgi:hypothetical protein
MTHNDATLLVQLISTRDQLVATLATTNYVGTGRQYHEARLAEIRGRIARIAPEAAEDRTVAPESAPTFSTAREEMNYLTLRHQVNEKAYAEGRITGPQFVACRDRIRSRMEAIMSPVETPDFAPFECEILDHDDPRFIANMIPSQPGGHGPAGWDFV